MGTGDWGVGKKLNISTLPCFLCFPTSTYSPTFMNITITGTIERREIGMGAWALVTDEGVTYEILRGADKNLLKAGQTVKIKGQVREDIMTTAMIGPVLEVKSFEVINSN
jgi:hypothetical protein